MKKITAFLLILVCILSLTACGKAGAAEGDEPLCGAPVIAEELTDDAKEAFQKATEAVEDAEYELIELQSTQVVAGINYTYLADKTVDGKTTQVLLTVYADLEGNCEITNEEVR